MLAIDRVPQVDSIASYEGLCRETWLMDARVAADISVSSKARYRSLNLHQLPLKQKSLAISAFLFERLISCMLDQRSYRISDLPGAPP